MSARANAERLSWHMVKETCPAVDAALADAAERIKEQTSALREALIDALMRLDERDGEIDDLKREIKSLESRLSEESEG